MRIPFSRADWPHAFNKVAKYLGRHATPKLTLSQAREKLARLAGYNSVHEVKKTLIEAHSESDCYPVDKLIRSMLLRGLIQFDESPNDCISLYSRLPLHDLSFWPHTDSHKEKVWLESMRANGKMVVLDEFGYYANAGVFNTPEMLAYMIEKFDLPPYTKAVRDDGCIFIAEMLTNEIRRLSDRDSIESLLADEFPELTLDSFIAKHLVPRVWHSPASLKTNMMQEVTPEYTHLLPDHLKVEPLIDGRFALYHQGLHAYLPVVLSKEALADQILPLWLGHQIQGDNGEIAEVKCKTDVMALRRDERPERYQRPPLKEGTGILLGESERVEFKGWTYRRVEPLIPYHQGLMEWISAQIHTDTTEGSPNTDVLDDGLYRDHQKISRWMRMNTDRLDLTQDQYNKAFECIDFTDLKKNLARVSEQIEFDPDYVEEAQELIEAYPIISQEFSVEQVTLLIEEITERTLYGTERHALLLLAEGLMASTKTYVDEFSAIDIIHWLISGRWRSLDVLGWSKLKADWIAFHQLWTQHDRQRVWINRIVDFLSRDIDPNFLNHSTDKLRTGRNKTMTDLMTMSRNMNLQLYCATQTIQDFNKR